MAKEPLYKSIQAEIIKMIEDISISHAQCFSVADIMNNCRLYGRASESTVRRSVHNMEQQGLIEQLRDYSTTYNAWRSVRARKHFNELNAKNRIKNDAKVAERNRQAGVLKKQFAGFQSLLERHNVHAEVSEYYGLLGRSPVSLVISGDDFDALASLLDRLNR